MQNVAEISHPTAQTTCGGGPRSRGVDAYLAEFERRRNADGAQPAWVRDLRSSGASQFAERGFPTTADEEYRNTDVTPIAERSFVLASEAKDADIAAFTFGETVRLVFVNGRFAPSLSLTASLGKGLTIEALGARLAADGAALQQHLGRAADIVRFPFAALNNAFVADGAVVTIAPNTVVSSPIHVLFVSTQAGAVSHPRVLLVAGENSQATVVETYAGEAAGGYFTNAVTEVYVGPHAIVDHYKVVRETFDAFHVALLAVRADRSATFSSHSFTLGGGIVRNDVAAVLNGEGVDCTLNGLYFGDRKRLVDNHTTLDHAMPHCGSHELYKGILTDTARAVFNGKIIVRPDAQKTDAKQTSRALLLSDEAQINTNPQLEIFADDVKCTHGAAIGQLDDEAIFYLRTRGLGLSDARNLLVHAFAGEILQRVKVESLRAQLDEVLTSQLPQLS